MSRMTLYHQINDYFEVFELFSVFFTVFHCFFTIRYPVSGTGYRISGFYRIFGTGYRIPDIRPDIRWVILSGPSLVLTFEKTPEQNAKGGILVIFAQNSEKSGFSKFIGHKHQNKCTNSANSY